jgi:hypothetical protein
LAKLGFCSSSMVWIARDTRRYRDLATSPEYLGSFTSARWRWQQERYVALKGIVTGTPLFNTRYSHNTPYV